MKTVLVGFALVGLLATFLPSTAAADDSAIYQPPGALALIQWLESAIPQFFPNHTGWEDAYDAYFDQFLVATFAAPGQDSYAQQLDFSGLKAVYGFIEINIASKLSHAQIDYVDAVAYPFPNDTTSGYLYFTGKEHGIYKNGTPTETSRDGTFATVREVNGVKKITEWRESSNFVF